MKTGATFKSAARVGCEGARSSSTMMVTMMAITPSLKASRRPVVISRFAIRRIYHGGQIADFGILDECAIGSRLFNLKSKICNLQSSGLLLQHAVHCAQAPDEISGIDRDNFSSRE